MYYNGSAIKFPQKWINPVSRLRLWHSSTQDRIEHSRGVSLLIERKIINSLKTSASGLKSICGLSSDFVAGANGIFRPRQGTRQGAAQFNGRRLRGSWWAWSRGAAAWPGKAFGRLDHYNKRTHPIKRAVALQDAFPPGSGSTAPAVSRTVRVF